jgi:hypothetical protein
LEKQMEAEITPPGAPSRRFLIFETAVAVSIFAGAAVLFVIMPSLTSHEELPGAQAAFTLSASAFPRLTFGTLAILCLTYIVLGLRQFRFANHIKIPIETGKFVRAGMILSCAILYPLLLPWFGFGVSTFLVIGGMTFFLGNKVWWNVLLLSVLSPVVLRFALERLLLISLPRASIEVLAAGEEALMQLLSRVFLHG